MKTKKPDAVEKLALKWVIDGHEAGGVKAIRSLIRREVKAERERCAAYVNAKAREYWSAGVNRPNSTSENTTIGDHLSCMAENIRNGATT